MYSIKKIEIENREIIDNCKNKDKMSTTLEQLVARVAELEKQMSEMTCKTETEKPSSKSKKPKKEKSSEPKKKRGVSGYLVFAKEMRQSARDTLVEDGIETPKPTEVLTMVAKMWRELSDKEKEVWNDKAKTINSGSEDSEPEAEVVAGPEQETEPEEEPKPEPKPEPEAETKTKKKNKKEN